MTTLRPALASDQKNINAIIRAANINPFNLHWQRFIVAEDGNSIVGVGQIKIHQSGGKELASIAVIPEYQHQGIASQIITALLQDENGPLYLFCRTPLAEFYKRFGFEIIPMRDLPTDLAKIHGLGEWIFVLLSRLFPKRFSIVAMRRLPEKSTE